MISLKQLHREEGGKCYYCDCQTHVPKKPAQRNGTDATREHLVPQAEGGNNNRINIKLACYKCNTLRGHMYAVTFKIIAGNPVTFASYKKAKQDAKYLNRIWKRERSLLSRALRDATGIIMRNIQMPVTEFNETFKHLSIYPHTSVN